MHTLLVKKLRVSQLTELSGSFHINIQDHSSLTLETPGQASQRSHTAKAGVSQDAETTHREGMATRAKKTRLPVQWVQKRLQSVPFVELPEQLTHPLGVVLSLVLSSISRFLSEACICAAPAHVSYNVPLSRRGCTHGDT
ncbi:TPA: hypothetical protein ACH3X1_006579 [Trebouxia sp. C0004]